MSAFAVRFNGVDAASLSALELVGSRGLHYGDGVFRTLLRHEGRLIDRQRQLDKLAADAQLLGLTAPAASVIDDDIEAMTAHQPSATIKLLMWRQGRQRGYRGGGSEVDRLLLAYPPPCHPEDAWTCGIRAFRSPVVMAAQPLTAGIKHLNRLEQVLAARDWRDGADEGILCDDRDQAVCGTRSNLFWVDHDGLHTPALDRCGVAGIMRDRVIEAARAEGVPVQIASAPWTHLMESQEAFVTNSLIGIWPLRALDERVWTAPGPVTARLALRLDHPRLVIR